MEGSECGGLRSRSEGSDFGSEGPDFRSRDFRFSVDFTCGQKVTVVGRVSALGAVIFIGLDN